MPRIIRFDTLEQFAAVNLLSDPGAIAGPVHVPQCAQITLRFAIASDEVGHCVLTGRYAGAFAGNVASANSILASLTTGATWTTLASFFASTAGLAAVTIRDINPVDGSGVLISSSDSGHPGTSVSPLLPAEVALVVTKRTARAGRQNRGRFYVPGWATNALGAGDVAAAAAVTALQNWATSNIGSALAASGYTHVLAQPARAAYTSPTTGRQFPARAATSLDITALQVRDAAWDSQRRRGRK